MREHPIPQDITGYRFHIIGSMTLKQFAEIALGVVIAVILYNTNLPAIIKWPIIGVSVGLGIAAAFLPIEERPLDHWIITFFHVLYKPTQFFWKKTTTIPKAFTYVPNAATTPMEPEIDLSPARRARIKEYIGSVTHVEQEPFGLTSEEQSRVVSILATFTTQSAIATPTPQPTPMVTDKPDLEVRIRKLRPIAAIETVVYSQNAQQTSPQLPSAEVAILQPETTPVLELERIQTPQATVPQQIELQTAAPLPMDYQVGQTDLQQTTPEMPSSVSYNTDLPFPSTPTEPNKVVGMVLTQDNDLISDAIVEIRSQDVVARAVKTNALGQFFITTPLADGEYTIVVEKDGFAFSPKQIVLSNTIVEPIELRSA